MSVTQWSKRENKFTQKQKEEEEFSNSFANKELLHFVILFYGFRLFKQLEEYFLRMPKTCLPMNQLRTRI